MALAAATTLFSQTCFAVLWKRLRIAFGCLQAADEQEEEQERQNEQANVDGVGGHKVRVENVISCCGGGTVNLKEVESYSRQRVTEALDIERREGERIEVGEYVLRLNKRDYF